MDPEVVPDPDRARGGDSPSDGVLLPSPAVMATIAFVASRVLILFTAKALTWMRPDVTVTRVLGAWDGGWYQWIAREGYPDHVLPESGPIGNRWAFAPGLPACIRAVHEVTGLSIVTSGLLITAVFALVGGIGVAVLIDQRLGREAALVAVLLLYFFPSAYVLSMIYTEALFVCCAAWCLWAIGRRNWVMAGLLASVACIVRTTGLVLVGTVVVVAAIEIVRSRAWKPVLGVVLAPIGQVGWMVMQQIEVGSPTATLDAQKLWYNKFVWFRTPFESLWQVLTDRRAWSDAQDVMAATALVFIVVSVVLAVRVVRSDPDLVPIEWWLYSAGTVLFALSPNWPSSVLRYALPAFPLYAVAWYRVPRHVTIPMVAVGAGVMATLGFAAFLGTVEFGSAPFAP